MPPKSSSPQTLSGLKKAQIIVVAQNGYNLGLNPACKIDQLRDDLSRRMASVLVCDNEGCGGGQCDPAVHIFPTELYAPAAAGHGHIEALLSVSQQDAPVVSVTDSPQEIVNPPADVAAQRRAVAEQALATVGLTLDEVANLDVVPLGGTPGGSGLSETQTGAKRKTGGVFRSMLAAVGVATPRLPLHQQEVPSSTPLQPRLGPTATAVSYTHLTLPTKA